MNMNKENTAQILNDVLKPIQGMDTEQITPYLSQIATVAITALRGVAGEEFVKDYLTAALNDSAAPTIKVMRKQ